MSEHDEKLDRAYRALAHEEPPPELDAAILAAARRAVARPSLVRRWAVPVSLAATLVLVVGVTLEMRHEQPGIATAPPAESGGAPLPQTTQESNVAAEPPEAKREKARSAPERAQALQAPASAPKVTSPPAAPKSMPPPAPEARFAAKRASGANVAADVAGTNPHDALEKIAKLRAEGRDEEADRALEEFRRRYPDYRIDDALWERVKPR